MNKHILNSLSLLVCICFVLTGVGMFAEESGHGHDDKHAEKDKSDDYPLDTCVVSGGKLGDMGDPIVIDHEGQTIKLCCKGCVKKFKKDPAKYIKKINDAKAKSEDADVWTCSMHPQAELPKAGKCPTCKMDLIKKEKDTSHPADVCVVSGEKMGSMGKAITFEHNGVEIKVCCKGCIKKFKANPEKYLKKMNADSDEKETSEKSDTKHHDSDEGTGHH